MAFSTKERLDGHDKCSLEARSALGMERIGLRTLLPK
jgi:hypothetical protein